MSLSAPLAAELQYEAASARKCLERVPDADFGWTPHEKSTPMGKLATHIAEMFGGIPAMLESPEFNLADDHPQPKVTTNAELVRLFDENLAKSVAALESASDETMMQTWTLRMGDHVIFSMPRAQVVRAMFLSHIIHHRGQLSVYLRLKNIPVPSIYGPSADDSGM